MVITQETNQLYAYIIGERLQPRIYRRRSQTLSKAGIEPLTLLAGAYRSIQSEAELKFMVLCKFSIVFSVDFFKGFKNLFIKDQQS